MYAAAALLLVIICSLPAFAATTSEEEYRKLQDRIQEHSKRLSEALERETSILGELEEVNKRMERAEDELRKYRRTLADTEAEVAALNAEIARMKAKISRQQEWIRRKLRVMHRFGYSGDTVTVLMSASDLSQMMRTWKYLERIAVHDHAMIVAYNDSLVQLNEKNAKLKLLTAHLKATTDKMRVKEAELSGQRKSKEGLLTSVRSEKSSHQKMIAELKAASRKLLDIIRQSSKTDTYAGTGFSRVKGRLHWPVDGKVAIPYGTQKDPQFETPVFRNGVHIQTGQAAEARAVYEGRVIFAEWFKGFGQLIIVNHGNGYHTLYGNLAEIFSRAGDIIKENQVIGRVGTSGILNAPGLYFEIRYKGKPLDPTQWLRGRRH